MRSESELTAVAYAASGHVCTITLNRPDKRNAQSRVLLEELTAALDAADRDPDIRVIIVRGAGPDFSAGHDLGTDDEQRDRAARPIGDGFFDRYQHARRHFLELTLRWRNVSTPTIAVVQGKCIWAGWLIASAMDIVFASDDAVFLPTMLQYFSVPWEIGTRKAKEVLFENRTLDAHEACELGFVNRVVPRDRLVAEATAYAGRVAELNGSDLAMRKLAINSIADAQGFTASLHDAFQYHWVWLEDSIQSGFADPERGRLPWVAQALQRDEDPSGTREVNGDGC